MSQREQTPLTVRLLRYLGGIQVLAAILAIVLAIYLASVGMSDSLLSVLNGLGYKAPRDFGFHEAGRVTGRAMITLLLYAPLMRFVERRNLLGVRIMAALALLRGLSRGEWILAAAVFVLSFSRSTARYLKADQAAQETISSSEDVMMDSRVTSLPNKQ